MEVMGTPGLLELGGRTRDTKRAAPIQHKLVKVRNEDPESTTKKGLEEQHSAGAVPYPLHGELAKLHLERRGNHENGFPGEKLSSWADGSASQQGLQTSLGILALWLVRR